MTLPALRLTPLLLDLLAADPDAEEPIKELILSLLCREGDRWRVLHPQVCHFMNTMSVFMLTLVEVVVVVVAVVVVRVAVVVVVVAAAAAAAAAAVVVVVVFVVVVE